MLTRCLRKDRRQRLQDASTVRIEIEDMLAAPAALTREHAATAWPRRAPLWMVAITLLVVGAGLAGVDDVVT